MPSLAFKPSRSRSPLVWMSGALVGFCAAALSVRGLSIRFDPFETNLARSVGGLVCILVFMITNGDRPRAISWRNVGSHVARNSFHCVGALLWITSVATLPLATVFSLEFTTPIWVAIFAAAFLGRRISVSTACGLLMGFVGVLIVVAPSPSTVDRNALLPLGTAVFFAIAILMTKALTRRNSASNVVFWMMATHTVASLACVVSISGAQQTLAKLGEGGADLWFLPVLALGGLVSQFCLTKALEHGNEVVVMTLDFLRLPLIGILGYLLYGESVGLHTIVGGAVVVTAVAVVTLVGKPGAPVTPAPCPA